MFLGWTTLGNWVNDAAPMLLARFAEGDTASLSHRPGDRRGGVPRTGGDAEVAGALDATAYMIPPPYFPVK